MELSDEIISHMMAPKNYGKLDDPGGVGLGYDDRSGEYVILYLGQSAERVDEIAFATNGCQDTVVLGSVFTEMVKGADFEEAAALMRNMEAKVAEAPEKQRACSELVLTAFAAAMQNMEHRAQGSDEEYHKIPIASSCATEEERE